MLDLIIWGFVYLGIWGFVVPELDIYFRLQ
jgi:hypothetical protein